MAVGAGAPEMEVVERAASSAGLDDAILLEGLEAPYEEESDSDEEEEEEESEDLSEKEEDSDDSPDDSDEDEEEDPESDPEPSESGSRSQRRIQSLVSERNEAQARAEAIERRYQAQLEQQQRSFAQLQQQQELLREQWRRQEEYQQRQIELLAQREDEKLAERDPVEHYRRSLIKEAEEKAYRRTSSEFESLKKEFEAYREEQSKNLRRAQEESERQQRFSFYEEDVKNTLLSLEPNLDPNSDLYSSMSETLIAMAAAHGKLPSQVAPHFQKMTQMLLKRPVSEGNKEKGKRVKAAQKLPSSKRRKSASDSSGVMFKPRPEYNKLRENGFNDYFEWREAGEPTL